MSNSIGPKSPFISYTSGTRGTASSQGTGQPGSGAGKALPKPFDSGASFFEPQRKVLVAGMDGASTVTRVSDTKEDAPKLDPWVIRLTGDLALNLMGSPWDTVATGAPLQPGSEVEVLGSTNEPGKLWLHVRTEDGREGYILGTGPRETVSGVAQCFPYVLSDGRDGSGAEALKFAQNEVGAGLRYGPDANGVTRCLRFMLDSFGLMDARDRCPEMYNPAVGLTSENLVAPPAEGEPRVELPAGQVYSDMTGTAIASWLALSNHGKTVPAAVGKGGAPVLPKELEPGAMVFFGATEKNGYAGHVAIATGETAPDGSPLIVTSGWKGSPEVSVMSLKEIQEASGPYLGYTTPERAFAPGTYGGGGGGDSASRA